jgi:hypothetical protein
VTEPNELFDAFLARSYSERMTQIADIAKAKETTDFDILSTGLRAYVAETDITPILAQIHAWLLLLPKRGSSKKMLWEDIALRLPVARLR